jgi:hypothetical protein
MIFFFCLSNIGNLGFFSVQGVLMIIDYCVAGTPREDINNIPDDSKDAEDLVSENDWKENLIKFFRMIVIHRNY